jgi:acyl-coenzyme A synthetase/AMP-(fatty) acid ligase
VIAATDGVIRGGAAAFDLPDATEPLVVVVAETRLKQADELTALARRIRERCYDAFLFGPDRVCLVASGAIPRTTSGKVRRHACRQLFLSGELPVYWNSSSDALSP